MRILRAENLLGASGVVHGFFCRTGGVSEGLYASLNCGPGSKDLPERVAENRRRAREQLGAEHLVTLYQIHSPHAVTVTEPWEVADNPKADALVTGRPGIALGVLAADCAPVLLADAQAGVIGAAHAGWSGALGGVIDSAVAAMLRLGAKLPRIRAAIGPCISQAAYEVGPEFEARFRAADSGHASFFAPGARPGHWQFALEAYVGHRLAKAGVGAVERLSACTYTREADFFSYRRATHRGEPDYGRLLSAIVLKQ